MRKNLSKKLRFEVFKRDQFQCAYCGAHPPSVVLQVDHIHPVVDGGTNDIDNLITSCQPCNLGKGTILLSNVPQSLKEKATLIAEQEQQLKGYYEVIKDRDDRLEDEMWVIADIIDTDSPVNGMKHDWLISIKRFLTNLDFYAVKDAAEIARAKFPYGGKRTFLYFCGVCHGRLRGQ